ncbi:MAG: DUF6285 domain-containing protein [Rhodospirillales bacterium]|nr:DUF6285 domain-containing protein [Rhodospirillales bacterium]
MRDGPCGAVLLAIARAKLLDEILPSLPREQIYTARMIANAMAIAARELGSDLAAAEQEMRQRVAALYRDTGLADAPPDVDTEGMERRLAADIRAGRFDTAEQPLLDLLRWRVGQRLLLANPKLVQGKKEAR